MERLQQKSRERLSALGSCLETLQCARGGGSSVMVGKIPFGLSDRLLFWKELALTLSLGAL